MVCERCGISIAVAYSFDQGEETKIEGDTLSFHYQKQRFTDKEFKNTIHLVPFDQLSYVEFKKERYYLTDIHFHLPSEHIINGKQEDIEFHFVHMNSKKRESSCGCHVPANGTGRLAV